MNIETFREYCLKKPGVTEETPFGPDTLVYKVMGKIFAITGLDSIEFKVNLKCDPDKAIELRERYEAVQPGYHMNKKHWNTVDFEAPQINESLQRELIDHSYDLIVASLSKKLRNELEELQESR